MDCQLCSTPNPTLTLLKNDGTSYTRNRNCGRCGEPLLASAPERIAYDLDLMDEMDLAA